MKMSSKFATTFLRHFYFRQLSAISNIRVPAYITFNKKLLELPAVYETALFQPDDLSTPFG
jgi:hypothetical protein